MNSAPHHEKDLSPIHAQALQWANAGCAVVPPRMDGSKAPDSKWKEFQTRKPTDAELTHWYGKGKQDGVGVITGAVSENLELLELEGRAITDGLHKVAREVADASGLGLLLDRVVKHGYLEATPSGGLHILYRISDHEVPGNTKVARRPGANGGVDVLVETRGEGGYCIVAPSHGSIHPSGLAWVTTVGSPSTIPNITWDERNALHSVFKALDEMPVATVIAEAMASPKEKGEGISPGDDFNARGVWKEILVGWSEVFRSGGVTYWRRPGKDEGISATTGRNDGDNLFVFTTSTVFQSEKPYSKFAALALLNYGEDYSVTAKALRQMGYGSISVVQDIPTPELRADGIIDYAPNELSEKAQVLDEVPTEKSEVLEAEEESSWKPIDLTPYLDGTFAQQEANILLREDGVGLLYPGRVHSFYGESESGKSWLAQMAVAQLLMQGRKCVYIDFEAEASDLVARLHLLGVWDSHITEHFTYIKPDAARDASDPYWKALLAPDMAELVIIDGVTESLTMWGGETKDNDMITRWMRIFPRTISAYSGAAVVTIDHVTKSAESRGRFAIGGQAKLATIDGAAYLVEPIDGIAPGRVGSLTVRVTKDRHGWIRQRAGMFRKSDRTQEVAVVVLDSTSATKTNFTLAVPKPENEVIIEKQSKVDLAIIQFVQANPGCSKRVILAGVDGARDVLANRVEVLRREGFILNHGTSNHQQLVLHDSARSAFQLETGELGFDEAENA